MGSEIVQRWDDLLKSYSLLKENLTVLHQNGYSFGKILHISRIDKIFLCAVFFKNGSYDREADTIINNFDEHEKSQFTQYEKLFEFVEEEEEKKINGNIANVTEKDNVLIELDDEDGERGGNSIKVGEDEKAEILPPLPPPPAATRSQRKEVQFNEVNEIREYKQENLVEHNDEDEVEDKKSESEDGSENDECETSDTNIKVEPKEEMEGVEEGDEDIIESIEKEENEDNASSEEKVEDVNANVKPANANANAEVGLELEAKAEGEPELVNALVRNRKRNSEKEEEEEEAVATKRIKIDGNENGSNSNGKIHNKVNNPLLEIIPGYKDLSADDLRFRDFKENREKYYGEDGNTVMAKIEFDDSENVLLLDKVEEIMKSVRMKIQKFIVLLLKVEAEKMDVLEQRYIEREMEIALGLLREYGVGGAVGGAMAALRAGAAGAAGAAVVAADVFVRVNCDNERMRFKLYELGSRVRREARLEGGEAPVPGPGAQRGDVEADVEAEELREQVRAVVEVVQRAAEAGDGELLRAARRAAARLSRACEEHLSGVLESLERAQLVCEAAADATTLAAAAAAAVGEAGEGGQPSAGEE